MHTHKRLRAGAVRRNMFAVGVAERRVSETPLFDASPWDARGRFNCDFLRSKDGPTRNKYTTSTHAREPLGDLGDRSLRSDHPRLRLLSHLHEVIRFILVLRQEKRIGESDGATVVQRWVLHHFLVQVEKHREVDGLVRR